MHARSDPFLTTPDKRFHTHSFVSKCFISHKMAVQRGCLWNRLWPWRRPSTKKVHVRSPTSAWRTCGGSSGSGTGRSVSFQQAAHTHSLTHSLAHTSSTLHCIKQTPPEEAQNRSGSQNFTTIYWLQQFITAFTTAVTCLYPESSPIPFLWDP